MSTENSSLGRRHTPESLALNLRDLGGIATGEGRLKSGRLFRSGGLTGRPQELAGLLEAMGISRVVDLRSDRELDRAASPLADHPAYVSAPLVDPRMEHLRDPAAERHLGDLYRGSVDRNGRTIAAAVQHLVQAPDGGVLVHCAAGKDRTGILVAIVLEALGTPPDAITADYCASEPNLVGYFTREMEATPDPRVRARLAELRGAPAPAMEDLLVHLRSRHGGGAAYFSRHGLSHEDLTRLSTRLVHRRSHACRVPRP